MKRALAALALAGLAIAGCGGSPPAQQVQVHGAYADGCLPGQQVTITSPSGKVIGTAIISGHAQKISVGYGLTTTAYTWKATVPAEPRYGLSVGSLPRYWASPGELRKGLDLACGGS